MLRKFFLLITILLPGCIGIPEDVTAVREFDVEGYLGTWYEIARLDHSFERRLIKVTANYTLREDGGIKVVNKGFDPETNIWKEAVGKAYFIDDPKVGRLRVSFWGPFYGAYNIIDLDKENYSYSLVCGPSKSYLWILSREPHMEESIKLELVKRAKALGFKTEKLIYVAH